MKSFLLSIAFLSLVLSPVVFAEEVTSENRSEIYSGCYNGCYEESTSKDAALDVQCKKSCQCLADDFDQYLSIDEFADAKFDSNNNPTSPKMKGLLDHCIKAIDE